MAKWIDDPQNRSEVEKVTKELKLPIWQAWYKGKFRDFWSECWSKIEDKFVELKDGKVNKSGDTMTGRLTLETYMPFLQFNDTRTGNIGGYIGFGSSQEKILQIVNRHKDGMTLITAPNLNTDSKEIVTAINELNENKLNKGETHHIGAHSYSWKDTKGRGKPAIARDKYAGWNPDVRLKSNDGWFSIGTYAEDTQFNIVGFKDSNNSNSPDTSFCLNLEGKGYINGKNIITSNRFNIDETKGFTDGTMVGLIPERDNEFNFSSSTSYIYFGYRKQGEGEAVSEYLFGNSTESGGKQSGTVRAGNIFSNGKKVMTCPYEVGDIYITTSGRNPATQWVGTTWKKIEGRFLKATSSGEGAGNFGGSNSKTLTINELPKHNHTQSPHSHTQPKHKHKISIDYTGSSYSSGADINKGDKFGWTDSYISAAGGENTGSAQPSISYSGKGKSFDIKPAYYTVHVWKRLS